MKKLEALGLSFAFVTSFSTSALSAQDSSSIHCRSILSGISMIRALEGPSLNGQISPMHDAQVADASLGIAYSVSTVSGQPAIVFNSDEIKISGSGNIDDVISLDINGLSPRTQHYGCYTAERLTIVCSAVQSTVDAYVASNPDVPPIGGKAVCNNSGH